jgi:hypothetical protein
VRHLPLVDWAPDQLERSPSSKLCLIEIRHELTPMALGRPPLMRGTQPEWFRIVHQGVRLANMTKPEGGR